MVKDIQIQPTKYKDNKALQTRLQNAWTVSRREMKPFLQFRKEIAKVMVGGHYASGSLNIASHMRRPINKVEQAIGIYNRLLVARNPNARVTSENPDLKHVAFTFEQFLEKDIKEMKFDAQLRAILLDALLAFGVSKCGWNNDGHVVEAGNEMIDVAAPYFLRVSPDDFVADMTARTWETMQFVGDRIERDLEKVKEAGLYDERKLKALTDTDRQESQSDQMNSLSVTKRLAEETLFPRLVAWEIYIPRDKVIVTMPDGGGEFLRVQEYDGPEAGPYEMLGFTPVPDNLIPLSPAMSWVDLDDAINVLVRKFVRQAERQKTIPAGMKKDKADATVIRNASDGEMVLLDNPGAIQELRFGGVDGQNMQFAMWMIQSFSMLAGNLEMLGGLAAQSETAAQDKILNQAAGVRIDDMRAEVVSFAQKNLEKLAWYRWTDPLREHSVPLKIKGLNFDIPSVFSPEIREGDFVEYNFSIEPYSMMPRSPSQDRAEFFELLQTVVMPLAPMWAQEGISVDAKALLDKISTYSNVHDLDEILNFMSDMQLQPGGQMAPAPKFSRREYIRKNVSGVTARGTDAQMMDSLAATAKANGDNRNA